MATPRRPYTAIADSLLWEPWSDELKLGVVRLALYIHERWRREQCSLEEACADVPLDRRALELVTGKKKADAQDRLLSEMAEAVSLSVTRGRMLGARSSRNRAGIEPESSRDRAGMALISWPKWAKYQGRAAPPNPNPNPKNPPTPLRGADKGGPNGRIRPKPDPYPQQAREAWAACREAAARHGKEWRKLTPSRVTQMAARLRENPELPPTCLVDAIEGAVESWGSRREMIDSYLTPETVFRPSNFTKYLEAAPPREPTHPDSPDPKDGFGPTYLPWGGEK